MVVDFYRLTLMSTRLFPGAARALQCFQNARGMQSEGQGTYIEIKSTPEEKEESKYWHACVPLAYRYRPLLVHEAVKGLNP